jgi:regulator of replication initiation timing
MLLAHMTRDQLEQELKSLRGQLADSRHCHGVQLENAQRLLMENERLVAVCRNREQIIADQAREILNLTEQRDGLEMQLSSRPYGVQQTVTVCKTVWPSTKELDMSYD